MKMAKFIPAILVGLSLVLTACGGGGGGTTPPPVNVVPTASITASPSTVVIGEEATFNLNGTDANTGDVLVCTLDAEGNGGAPDSNVCTGPVKFTYTSAGTFTATFSVTDGKSSPVKATATVKVNTPTPTNRAPVARLTASARSCTAPCPISFNASASSDPDGDSLSFTYDFGDGSTGSGVTTSHTYTNTTSSAVTRTVVVTASDGKGGTDTEQVTVTVNPTPPPTDTTKPTVNSLTPTGTISNTITPAATASDNVGVQKVEFYFDGTLIGTDTSSPYNATFDTTSVSNGSHTLAAKATDTSGNVSDLRSNTVTVSNAPPVDNPPSATLSASPTSITAGQSTTFTRSGTDDKSGLVCTLDFKDGTATSNGCTGNVPHTYAAAGTYVARFTATDSAGQSTSREVTISVTVANSAPVASFTTDKTSGTAPLTVQFSSTSTDSDGTIASCLYTFGGDGTSTACNVSKTFNTAGTYDVTLKVTDNGGKTSTSSAKRITVTAPPTHAMAGLCDILPAGQNRNYIGTVDSNMTFDVASCDRPPTASASMTATSRLYRPDGSATPTYLVPDSSTGTNRLVVYCIQDNTNLAGTTQSQKNSYRNKVISECVTPVMDAERQVFAVNVFVYDTTNNITYGVTGLSGKQNDRRLTQVTIVNIPTKIRIDDLAAFVHEKEVLASSNVTPESGVYLQGLTGVVVDGSSFSDPVGGADTMVAQSEAGLYKFTRKDGKAFEEDGTLGTGVSTIWNPAIMHRRGLWSRQMTLDMVPGIMTACADITVRDRAAGLWTCSSTPSYTMGEILDYANANGTPRGVPDPDHSVRVEDSLMVVAITAADFRALTMAKIGEVDTLRNTNSTRISNGTRGELSLNWVNPGAILLPGATVRVESP